MAITKTPRVRFEFESSTGVLYDVDIVEDTGVGTATPIGAPGAIDSTPRTGATKTAITVDGGSLSAWQGYHESRKIYAAVYNTTQALSAILT